jgi:hypothetical protein
MEKLKGGRAGWVLRHLLSVLVVTFLLLLSCLFGFFYIQKWLPTSLLTTFSDRCLGSNNDEGRSEV